MVVEVALVPAADPPGENNYAAVNLGLELEQGEITRSFVKQNCTYAQEFVTVHPYDGAVASSSESACDSQSTSSRTGSPDSSNPGTSSTTQDTESASGSGGASSTPPLGSKSISDPRTSSSIAYEIQSEPRVEPFVLPPSTLDIPELLFKPYVEPRKKRSIGGTISAGWSYAKRLDTLPRDLRALVRYLRLLYRMRCARRDNLNVPTAFDQTTAKHPQKVAFYLDDEEWTFAQVQAYSLRIASVFRGKVEKGDAVALVMENRVEYIAIWLGLARLGAVPALLNINLRHKSLSHCISSADCKMVVCGAEMQEAIQDIVADIATLPIYVSGAGEGDQGDAGITLQGAHNLDTLLTTAATVQPPEQSTVNFADKMVYIYTSGTTGLPKAAVITHSRYIFAGAGMLCLVGITSSDVLYVPLPLYHTAGGNIGVGMTLCDGVTLALRKRFSVTQYFPDCKKYGCTVAQYIGEICRYLLNSPASTADRQHKIRVMFGNGLRPQIWEQFQDRFNIPRISEFYGSTEGNANIINMDGRVGAVGFLSVLLPFVYPCALIKVDTETGKPIRNAKGICIRCKPGEPGEFIGKIVANDPVREFKGYADKKATSKKIIHDVFRKGDSAFLSGDLLVMDAEGYLYFKDRTGDTFRWKGENVSTAEVENNMSTLLKSTDLCVYGVEVPGTEGRAGMAAVVDADGDLEMKELAKGVTALLPVYARPLFVRIVESMQMTSTYKMRKTELQKEGFDIHSIKDLVYFLDTKKVAYIPLSESLYARIKTGDLRL